MSSTMRKDMAFSYGVIEQVSPLIRRVVCKNPSPFTLYGTGTYIIGHGSVAVVDPGPAKDEHIDAILSGLGEERVSHIVVTHTHLDHSPGCRLLQPRVDAKTHGFGPHPRSGPDARGVEEGVDHAFCPDVRMHHGDLIEGNGWSLECVHTPGHTTNHMCYQLREERALLSGDHVMGWSTSVIVPPDGDMGAYMKSLELLLARDDRVYWPTHGPPIAEPHKHVRAFVAHRKMREAAILAQLGEGERTAAGMLDVLYPGLQRSLQRAAALSTLATLIDLERRGVVRSDAGPTIDAEFYLTSCYSGSLPTAEGSRR